jgi:hypothetical protein
MGDIYVCEKGCGLKMGTVATAKQVMCREGLLKEE